VDCGRGEEEDKDDDEEEEEEEAFVFVRDFAVELECVLKELLVSTTAVAVVLVTVVLLTVLFAGFDTISSVLESFMDNAAVEELNPADSIFFDAETTSFLKVDVVATKDATSPPEYVSTSFSTNFSSPFFPMTSSAVLFPFTFPFTTSFTSTASFTSPTTPTPSTSNTIPSSTTFLTTSTTFSAVRLILLDATSRLRTPLNNAEVII
jgi:hypothetical protein